MSCIRSLAAVSFLASIGFSTTVIAQEMISDTTARKQPLKAWGVQFEEFEYRYSDDDEELGVWDADAFYGTDEFKVRLLTTGEYEIEEQAYETLENQLVGQIPISKFFDAKAGVRFDTPEGPEVFNLRSLSTDTAMMMRNWASGMRMPSMAPTSSKSGCSQPGNTR